MKIKYIILLIILLFVIFLFKYFTNNNSSDNTTREYATNSSNKAYSINDLDNIHNTQHFLHNAIKHIFLGSVNKEGDADGYHYNNIKNINSFIVFNSETSPNQYGVYKAKAVINGHTKSDDNGYSTFFPNHYSPQQIINLINQAYSNKYHIIKNIYLGTANNGMEIEMYLTSDSKIISAFPKY